MKHRSAGTAPVPTSIMLCTATSGNPLCSYSYLTHMRLRVGLVSIVYDAISLLKIQAVAFGLPSPGRMLLIVLERAEDLERG